MKLIFGILGLVLLVQSAAALNSTGVQLWLPLQSNTSSFANSGVWSLINSSGNFSFVSGSGAWYTNALNVTDSQLVFNNSQSYVGNNWTIGFWMQALTSTVNNGLVFEQGNRNAYPYEFVELYVSNGELWVNSDNLSSAVEVAALPSIPNTWVYYTLSCNTGNGEGILYTDGSQASVIPSLCGDSVTGSELYLFNDNNQVEPLNALVQYFSYYGVTLGASDVQSLYSGVPAQADYGMPDFNLFTPQFSGVSITPSPPYFANQTVTLNVNWVMPSAASSYASYLNGYSFMDNFNGTDENISYNSFAPDTSSSPTTLQVVLPQAGLYVWGAYATSTDGLENFTGVQEIWVNSSSLVSGMPVNANTTPCVNNTVTIPWVDSNNYLSSYDCQVDFGGGLVDLGATSFPANTLTANSVCSFENSCLNQTDMGVLVTANDSNGLVNETTFVVVISNVTATTTTTSSTSTSTTQQNSTIVPTTESVTPTPIPSTEPSLTTMPEPTIQPSSSQSNSGEWLVGALAIVFILGMLYVLR